MKPTGTDLSEPYPTCAGSRRWVAPTLLVPIDRALSGAFVHDTQVRPMRDRRGRVYTPAVGPRLRPLLWVILVGFALLGANGFYLASVTALTWYLGTTQQTFFYMLMVAPAPGARLRADRAVPGLRVRAPGDLVEAAEQGGDPLRAGPAGRGARHPGLGLGPGPARRRSRSATRRVRAVGYWLHVSAAARGDRALRQASPGRAR